MSKKYTLIAVTAASFLTPFMSSAVNLAIPAIGQQFNGDMYQLSLVATSYLLASAAFLLPFGRLSDLVGRRKVFASGIIMFTLTSFLCGLAWSLESLIAFRIFQGIGGAMLFATSISILTLIFSPLERGKVLGINAAAVYTGLSLGPVLGGTINHYLGWHYIFFFTALAGLLVFYFVFRYMNGEWIGAREEKFDKKGAVFYGVGLVAFMYGASSLARWEGAIYLFVLGLVVLVYFIFYELRQPFPLIQLSIFRKNIAFAFSSLAALISYSATYAVGFLLSLDLQIVRGFDSQLAGLILLCQPIFQAVFSPFAGRLSDRVEPRIVASLGMAVTTVGLFFFAFLSENTPLSFIIINLALLGIGFAFFASPNNNAIMSSVEKKEYGVASAVLGTMRLLGQSFSMALMTLVSTIYLGKVSIASNNELLSKSTGISFLLFTIISFGGIFASMISGNPGRNDKKATE